MSAGPLVDLRAAVRLVKEVSLQPLPEAYLHDREHLSWLALVTRAAGREPFPSFADGSIARLTGIPIFIDPTVEPNVLELRWPDGKVEQIRLDQP